MVVVVFVEVVVCASERASGARGGGGGRLEIGVHHPDTRWEDLVPPFMSPVR